MTQAVQYKSRNYLLPIVDNGNVLRDAVCFTQSRFLFSLKSKGIAHALQHRRNVNFGQIGGIKLDTWRIKQQWSHPPRQ
jgi:hypothetical protein